MYSPDEHKKRCKEYYQKHKKEIRERRRKEYWQNREQFLTKAKEYAQQPDQKKRIAKYQKKYREEHKEELKKKRGSYQKDYYQKNKENIKIRERRYRKENVGKVNARKRELRKLDPDRFREYDKKHYENRKHLYKQIQLISNPFPSDVDVDFHHIYPWFPFTIPMPREIHQTYNMELEKHITYNKEWFEKLYSMEVDNLLGLKPLT